MPSATPSAADTVLNTPHAPSQRMLLIDGLRGIAAVAVLLFHISINYFFKINPGWVQPLNALAYDLGALGVEIFFVISGFVICYSLRNARINPPFIGAFVIRRSLRLDPPYWATIAAAVLTSWILTRFLHASMYPVPSAPTIAVNAFYLQGILHQEPILIVFWTLCFEIQFYLLFVALQWGAQRTAKTEAAARRNLTFMLYATGALSACLYARSPLRGAWCFNWWFLFAFGAIMCQTLFTRHCYRPLAAALALAILAISTANLQPAAGALTGITIFLAIQFGGLYTWLGNPVFQYLGRISYSLYLTHTLVLQVLGSLFAHLRWGAACHSIGAFAVMIAGTLLLAELFYRAIERPSHRLAIRFGRRAATHKKIPIATPAQHVQNVSAPMSV